MVWRAIGDLSKEVMTFPFAINDHVALATEMMQTRLRLNQANYDVLKQLCHEEQAKCQRKVRDLVGHDINVGSSKQVCAFLYDELKLKVRKNKKTGGQTSDENALRELRVQYPQHKTVLNAFIEERKIAKKIESYIEIAFDEDGYIPYSANPAGTETNRWSFSKSPRDRGLNAQTLPKVMRVMCDAPPGRVFICPDLPQADARIVAWDAKCERLIELFLNPNIHFHLENCIRLFGLSREEAYGKDEMGIPWKDRDPRYVLGKAMGHAANYRMAAKRLAMELGVELAEAKRLLNFYLYGLYPEIPRWHNSRKEQVSKVGYLETPDPFFRRRTFYGAWGELMLHGKLAETTWNEMCAHVPQSVVADIVNVGMDRLWKTLPYVWFHKHDHDSYLASTPVDQLGETCRKALEFLKVELRIHKRPLTMVPEMQYGANYGLLIEWKGEETFDRDTWSAKVCKKLDPEKLRKDLYGYY